MSKSMKYVMLLIVLAVELAGFIWIRGEYKVTLSEGAVYRTPVTYTAAKNSNEIGYIVLDNPMDEVVWQGEEKPVIGETVHIAVSKDKKGNLALLHAETGIPEGDYITVRVTGTHEDLIRFDWPNNRLYISGHEQKEKAREEIERSVQIRDYITDKVVSHMENELIATLRIKDGHIAYEDVTINGRPILDPAPAAEKGEKEG